MTQGDIERLSAELMDEMRTTIREARNELAAEFRGLLDEVRQEREELFSIVVETCGLPALHRIAELLESRKAVTRINPGGAPKKI